MNGIQKIALLLAAAAGIPALSGCTSSGATEHSYLTTDGATASSMGGNIPGFLPADATDIRLRVDSINYGSQLRWKSATGLAAEYCKPGTIAGTRPTDVPWWPASTPSKGWRCAQWNVFEEGAAYYAWDTRGSVG